jgi:hypothetical protein
MNVSPSRIPAVGNCEESLMNCDEVFAILTRGPFPSGDRHDRFVEAHLQMCAECQRLAEALRPNDEHRPEAVAPEDTVSLPGYWGGPLHAVTRPLVSLAQNSGRARPQRSTAPARVVSLRGYRINLWQFTAAIALGIVMAAVLRTFVGPSEPNNEINRRGAGGITILRNGVPITDFDLQSFVQRLPPECLRGSAVPVSNPTFGSGRNPTMHSAQMDLQRCCTQCHYSGSADNPTDNYSLTRLHRGCALCHHWD